MHFRAALEQEIARGITAQFDYTQINVARMDRVRDINLFPPVADATGRPIYSGTRPLAPQYGFAYITEPSARSLYRGFTSTLTLRRQHFVVDATYTLGWSTSHDDHERGGFSGANYVDAFHLDNEYNYSNIDQRHQFASSGLVYMPYGFEVSTTMRFNTGRPFSPSTGADSNRDGVVRDRPVLDGQVVKRNTFRNRGFSDVSLRVQRHFELPNEKGENLRFRRDVQLARFRQRGDWLGECDLRAVARGSLDQCQLWESKECPRGLPDEQHPAHFSIPGAIGVAVRVLSGDFCMVGAVRLFGHGVGYGTL